MAKLGISDAFARYGAKLKNVNWSVSAEAPDGSLVVSLWQHHFAKGSAETLVCRDSFNRWSGPGNAEFRERVAFALATRQRVRLVLVETGIPSISRTHPMMPNWQQEVCNGTQGKTEIYPGVQAGGGQGGGAAWAVADGGGA